MELLVVEKENMMDFVLNNNNNKIKSELKLSHKHSLIFENLYDYWKQKGNFYDYRLL